ncbi:glycosyltransferase [Nocardioides sp. LHD-245]|uniref:glycosyltransferase n=1 Tax=Nocardioides sp. LHD-245 TaxID=3051387 RepID=UPI0027E07033|nr:glycosyltransferase [Nocardioides sp. LHD-245]
MRRLRVAVVQQGGVLGGAERWQLQLADATDRLSVTTFGLGAGATTAAWARRGWPVATVPDGRSFPRLATAAWRLRRALARDRPDVVLAHGVKAGLVAAAAAHPTGIPVVWVRHDASYAGALVGLLDRLTQGQVATSSWLLEGRSPRAGVVVNPPRMPEPVPAAEARALLGIDPAPGELVLGMAARVVRHKGIEDAVRALALPGAAAWELVVAGVTDPAEPDEQDRLVKLAADLGVAERVRFLGEVPDVARVVTAFDALAVLTKPTAAEPWLREAFGMSALEALTGGVPVVAVPPVDDIAVEGGLPVRAGRPDEVAAALATLADAGTRRRIGDAARRRARDFPDAVAAGGRLADFLALLTHRPGVGHQTVTPSLSVVTTVLDDEQGLTELLTALVPQLGPDDELVVVDGGSTDGTADVARRAAEADPRVRLVVEPGAGISRGRNVGVGLARHDAVACTDAGCVPTPGWLAALRGAFDRHPDVDLFTGTYRVLADRPWELALAAVGYPSIDELARPRPGVRAYGRLFGRSFDPSMPTGRSVAFTRRAWAAAGGFPEHLATGEDVLFGRSVVAAGHRARMVRDAEVAWAQRPTLLANLRMLRRYGEGSGHSLDRRLLGRDLARAASYVVGVVVLARGGRPARTVVAGGAAAYLSLPVARAARGPRPLITTALVPPVTAARDLAKAGGALSAVAAGLRRRR